MNKTYRLTGLFVLVGILCFAGIICFFIKQKFTTNQDDLVVMYFEESIQGLSAGSAVVFKGVEVGKVESISLRANLTKGTFKSPVFVLFDLENSMDIKDSADLNDKQMLDNLIAKGLRARLISANYLTGQLMIELVMEPKTPAELRGTGKYWEIPTIYSPFAQISKDLEEIPLQDTIVRIGNLIDNIDENIPVILDNITDITTSLSEEAPDTVKSIKQLTESLNKSLPAILQSMNNISAKIDKALNGKNSEFDKTMENVNKALDEFVKASRSIKNLSDYLERHPEAIIQGKGK
ncbi:MAG: MCE family protein [Alphaproteobacteria bacterium]|nr:MCE family protein [Alphaproteobacteria bacterium]